MYKIGLISLLVFSLTACNSTQVAQMTTTANETVIESTAKVELEVATEITTARINETETSENLEVEAEIETTVVDKWANYSAEVRAIIEKYNGEDTYSTLFDGNKLKNYEELKKEAQKLADEGLYIVGFSTHGMNVGDLIKGFKDYNKGHDASKTWTEEEMSRDVYNGNIQIMTWDEAVQWGLDFYNKYGDRQEVKIGDLEYSVEPWAYGVDNQTYDKKYNEYASPISNASHLYTANYQNEVYTQRQEYLNQFILRNETAGSPAKYINALGGREYFRDEVSGNVYTKDGLSWENDRNGSNWCKNRGIEFKDYRDVEMIVFKKNNPDTIFGDLPFSYSHTKYKVFHSGNGEPRWVERDPSAFVYDIYGYKLSPVLYKSIEKYSQYCGGTTVAFDSYYQGGYIKDNKVSTKYYDNIMGGFISAEDYITAITDSVKENPYYYK